MGSEAEAGGVKPLARLRCWAWRFLRRYRYEMCQRCGRPVEVVWTAPDALWLEVHESEGGIRCVECFDRDCDEQGISVRWRPVVEYRKR